MLVSGSVSDRDLENGSTVSIVIYRVALQSTPFTRSHSAPSFLVVFTFDASGRREVGLASVNNNIALSAHTTNNYSVGDFVVADYRIAETVTLTLMASLMANECVNVCC